MGGQSFVVVLQGSASRREGPLRPDQGVEFPVGDDGGVLRVLPLLRNRDLLVLVLE